MIEKRPITITVCADGFVSVMQNAKERRLKAALPVWSAWTMQEAMELVSKVCVFRPCFHGGKLGMTIEAQASDWPRDVSDAYEAVQALTKKFEMEEQAIHNRHKPKVTE